MNLMSRVSALIWPSAYATVRCRLDEKLAESLKAASEAVASAQGVQAQNREDHTAAEAIKEQVRIRIGRQDERRYARLHDPRVAVIQDTIRILEDRA